MSKGYLPSEEIRGEKPFRCQVCKKKLLISVEGQYKLKLFCSKCKSLHVVVTQIDVSHLAGDAVNA